jgi:hypothetical protein
MPPDHLAVLYEEDMVEFVPEFLEDVWSTEFDEHRLEIVCPAHSNVDVLPILQAAKDRDVEFRSITLLFATIEQQTLATLLERWNSVHLHGCSLGEGWCEPPRAPRACSSLTLEGCTVAPSGSLAVGASSWDGLSRLAIDEGYFDRRLTSDNCYEPDPIIRHQSLTSPFPRAFLRAFWGEGIEHLRISDRRQSPSLHELERLPRLKSVSVTGTPASIEDFIWLTENPALSWLPETRMPWELLDRLRNLVFLDLSSSQCTDADLNLILDHTQLRTIHLYYSRSTQASLARLLSTQSMRAVWASTEVFSGDLPSDLPTKSNVQELVALNGGLSFARRCASLYPGMVAIEM